MNFRVLENQSESWKGPGNLFLKRGVNPVYYKRGKAMWTFFLHSPSNYANLIFDAKTKGLNSNHPETIIIYFVTYLNKHKHSIRSGHLVYWCRNTASVTSLKGKTQRLINSIGKYLHHYRHHHLHDYLHHHKENKAVNKTVKQSWKRCLRAALA